MSWEMVRLGDVCDVFNGSTPKTDIDDYWNGSIVWVTPTDLGRLSNKIIYDSQRHITIDGYNSANTNMLPINSIVLSTRAPIGHIAISGVELCTNQGCKGIVPRDKIYADFLFYYLLFHKDDLAALGSGTTFKELSTKALTAFEIPLPPHDEQRRIASEIEHQLAAVEKAKQAAMEQLEAAQALNAAYLREVFEGNEWDKIRLGDVCSVDKSVIDGILSPKPYLGLEMIESGSGVISWSSNRNAGISACYEFDSRHILYGKLRPYLNKVALPQIEGRCSTEIIPLLPNSGVCREFIAFLLRRKETIDYVMPENTGSRMPRADVKHLLKMSVPLPPTEIQKKIVECLKKQNVRVEKAIIAIQNQLDTINAMPTAILRQAFSGH